MNVYLATLLLALSAQVGRYGDAAAPAAETASAAAPSAADAAVDADAAGTSQITLPAETPTPTLVEEPAAAEPAAADSSAAAPAALDAEAAAAAAFADPFTKPATATAPAIPPAAAATAPAAATASEASVLTGGPKPGAVMQQLLATPAAGQLPGIAVSLGDAMRGASDRATQTTRAQAYWNLSAAVGQYYLALREADDLAGLRQGVLKPAASWDVTAADFAKRVDQTRLAATAAQLRLHRLMGAAAGVSLPLPADLPHCGRYNTRYAEIFTTHMDPAARQLNDLLPLLHGELVAQVRLVTEAAQWLEYVSVHRDPATDGVGLLRAYELMALHRREFVETAHEYNCQIAAYAELAAPDQVGPERLVAMLIRVSNGAANGPAMADGGEAEQSVVEPASAIEPAQSDPSSKTGASSEKANRRTFAFHPFERLRNRERSIVTVRRLLRLPGRNRNYPSAN